MTLGFLPILPDFSSPLLLVSSSFFQGPNPGGPRAPSPTVLYQHLLPGDLTQSWTLSDHQGLVMPKFAPLAKTSSLGFRCHLLHQHLPMHIRKCPRQDRSKSKMPVFLQVCFCGLLLLYKWSLHAFFLLLGLEALESADSSPTDTQHLPSVFPQNVSHHIGSLLSLSPWSKSPMIFIFYRHLSDRHLYGTY